MLTGDFPARWGLDGDGDLAGSTENSTANLTSYGMTPEVTGVESHVLLTVDGVAVTVSTTLLSSIDGDEDGFEVYTLRRVFGWLRLGKWRAKSTAVFEIGLRWSELVGGELG